MVSVLEAKATSVQVMRCARAWLPFNIPCRAATGFSRSSGSATDRTRFSLTNAKNTKKKKKKRDFEMKMMEGITQRVKGLTEREEWPG